MTMRQVTASEAKVLQKFHKIEVRYYVDTDSWKSRKKTPKLRYGVGGNKQDLSKTHVQLTMADTGILKSGCMLEERYKIIRNLLEADPTHVIPRKTIAEKLAKLTKQPYNASSAAVGDLLKRGLLRYVGE